MHSKSKDKIKTNKKYKVCRDTEDIVYIWEVKEDFEEEEM